MQDVRPDKIVYLNVFNTGIIIDSVQVRNYLIKVIRKILK